MYFLCVCILTYYLFLYILLLLIWHMYFLCVCILTYLPSILRQRVLKFRLSNHRLPVQQRRSLGIPRDERICTVCDSGEVGDEFHYLLNCSNENVKRNRTKYVDKYYTHHPNVPKFCSLMNMTSKSKNIKLAKFISCILELF